MHNNFMKKPERLLFLLDFWAYIRYNKLLRSQEVTIHGMDERNK